MRVYYDRDADVNLIKGKKVAVVGYGSQGHAHALNLKDSGVKEIAVALRAGSAAAAKAEGAGLQVMDPAEAAKWADVVMVLTPDEGQGDLYREHLAPNLRPGAALAFAHGLNIHFNLIEPRAGYRRVHDRARKAPATRCAANICAAAACRAWWRWRRTRPAMRWRSRLSYASAIGGGRAGIIETTFKEECETDLFGEQAVLCGGVVELIKAGFETLVEARLRAGDGVFRVPARGEADRRPDLRGRHRQHELLDQQHRRVRRIRHRPARSSPPRPRRR